MKKAGYIGIGVVVVVSLAIIIPNALPPSSSDAINFVKKQVTKSLMVPDSAEFSSVSFYPDSPNQSSKISGYVCGYVNGKNTFGAYAGNRKFFSKIEVTNNGRSANMSTPIIEDPTNAISKGVVEKLWSENCR